MNEAEKSANNSTVNNPVLDELENVVRGEHSDPFQVLGPHREKRQGKSVLAIRALHPGALGVSIVSTATGAAQDAVKIHPNGLFESGRSGPFVPGAFSICEWQRSREL
jgi:hypothetical protein